MTNWYKPYGVLNTDKPKKAEDIKLSSSLKREKVERTFEQIFDWEDFEEIVEFRRYCVEDWGADPKDAEVYIGHDEAYFEITISAYKDRSEEELKELRENLFKEMPQREEQNLNKELQEYRRLKEKFGTKDMDKFL